MNYKNLSIAEKRAETLTDSWEIPEYLTDNGDSSSDIQTLLFLYSAPRWSSVTPRRIRMQNSVVISAQQSNELSIWLVRAQAL